MSNAVKAALLSGLLFPGLGHLSLKAYWRGFALVAVSLASLVVIVDVAVDRARIVADRILSGEVALDAAAIAGEVTASSGGSADILVRACTWALVACWLVGIFDSYRVGKSRDRAIDRDARPDADP